MAAQTQEVRDPAPTGAQLRWLATIGDDNGMRRVVRTDLVPAMPFPVGASWYETYWYGNRSEPNWRRLYQALRRLYSVLNCPAEPIRHTMARTTDPLGFDTDRVTKRLRAAVR